MFFFGKRLFKEHFFYYTGKKGKNIAEIHTVKFLHPNTLWKDIGIQGKALYVEKDRKTKEKRYA